MLHVPYNFMARSGPGRNSELGVPRTAVWTGTHPVHNWSYIVSADDQGHGHLWKAKFFFMGPDLTPNPSEMGCATPPMPAGTR